MRRTPKIGIFWWWRSRLLADPVGVKGGVEFNGVVHGGRDHVKVWPRFQRQFPALLDTDYIRIPRGRVLYLVSKRQYIVYLDRKLATPKVKGAVLWAFALPRRSTGFEFDPHYTTDRGALNRMFGDG